MGSDKSSISLPELNLPDWGKVGPGLGYGVGCGVGVGFGIFGSAGIGWGIPGLKVGFGAGAGCGAGVGFGYGVGVGRVYTKSGSFDNLKSGGVQKFFSRSRGPQSTSPLSDTEVGRLMNDIFQEMTRALASLDGKSRR
eukprot:jgi/Mesen1/1806/ME000140S00751